MAWVASRSGVGKILRLSLTTAYSHNKPTTILLPQVISIQTANISGKSTRDPDKVRPKPFPYKTKKYNFIRALFDKTTWRFDENSKIIVVEGPIAAGKSAFGKCLAEDLDMIYLPEVNMDQVYINSYGFDMRTLDPQMPESLKTYDICNFYQNPNHRNAARFQIQMYMLRFYQYADALQHLLSTGQGVVLERCVYSDFVFMETMVKCGYMGKGARKAYYDIVKNTIGELMRPHLVIYLDVPVNKVMQRIKKRNLSMEVNTKVLNSEYLTNMEIFYKQRYLKEISAHAELLVYDWSDFGDVEVVVEDIERIDFDRFEKHDVKLKDWRKYDEWEWHDARMLYSDKFHLTTYFFVPHFDVPELLVSGEEDIQYDKVIESTPELRYRPGFNKAAGDKGVLFKM